MSYIHKRFRVFRGAGDVKVHRKPSNGRMKTYSSATDARAWCNIPEERRQYILDLVEQGDRKGLSLGKYIPIDAIIDILLANKNRDIKRLQEENQKLKRLLQQHGIHYEETPVTVSEPQVESDQIGEPGVAVDETVSGGSVGAAGDGEIESRPNGVAEASQVSLQHQPKKSSFAKSRSSKIDRRESKVIFREPAEEIVAREEEEEKEVMGYHSMDEEDETFFNAEIELAVETIEELEVLKNNRGRD